MPKKGKSLVMELLKNKVKHLFFPDRQLDDSRSVGLELEIWPFRHSEHSPNELVRFENERGTGLIQLLRKLLDEIENLKYSPTPEGAHRFVYDNGGNLTFEPGGQLEYSGAPKPTLAEAIQDLNFVIEDLRCRLKPHGIWFFHSGLNPWYSIAEVGLQITKERYLHMNRFFESVGPFGQKMMRLSTSLQVNLDAGSPPTAQRRWLAANLLAPVFTAMFGNSPFVDGKATGAYSFRSLIWQRLDPSRAGIPRGFMTENYDPCPVEQYFRFALDAYCMRIPDSDGRPVFDGRFLSFRDWMEQGSHGYFPDIGDWDIHLSTLFPEVRARGFFELRFLDAQSRVWCAVPGILLTHLLYDREATEGVINLLSPYRTTLMPMLEVAARQGMDEPEIAGLAREIYALAMDAAEKAELPTVLALCEQFYQHYTSKNRNPAHDLLDLNEGRLFTPAQYRDFEKRQVDRAGEILDIICEYS